MITNVKKISLLIIAAVLVMALAFAGAASAATAITNATDFQEALGGDQYASINGNVVTLKKNVQLDDELCIENATGLTLDLNGYTVTAMEGGILFNVEEYQDDEEVKHPSFFTLNDSIGTGKLIGNGTSSDTTHCVSVDGGGGERHNATFTMNGGSITSCAGLVNAVSLNNGATFTMNGGNITGCSGSVGGVAVLSSTFNMNGGTITGCSGNDAGGVFVDSGTFNMNGGTITGCTVNTEGVSGSGGGGVRVNSGTFNVTGSATITGNTNSTGAANNVCLLDNNYLNLVGDLTGSIGILSVTWDIQEPKLGEQFGTSGSTTYTGADHFFADTNASLVGSINATNALVWTTKPSIAYVEVKTWDELVTNVTAWNKKDEMLTIVVMEDLRNTTGGTNYTGIPVNGKVTIMPKANAGEIKIDANQEGRLFEVKANGNLKLVGNGTATLTLTNGKYIAQTDKYGETDGYGGGGAIYVNGGNLTLSTGAKISNCSAANVGATEAGTGAGGAIYVNGGNLTLSTGAMISNCSLVEERDGNTAGGAVFISTTSTIVMSGGCIKDCTAINGGGVYVYKGTFNMTDGTIDNCSTNINSGGVYVSKNAEFNMNGGTITKCSARYYGGGVYVVQGGKFTMAGGIIDNCRTTESSNAGGAGVYTVGAFTMTDGTIINCSAGDAGGAVMIGNSNPNYKGTFTMTGGNIENCSANRGGGVYVSANTPSLYGTFTMTGGSITKCSADTYGGGVHSGGNGVFKVGGTANITDNTKGTNPGSANNVFLFSTMVINVISPLTAGAQINVTTQYAPTAPSPINITSVCGSGNETYFGSDNTNYVVGYNPTTQTVQLGRPLEVTYDGNGNTSGTVPVDSKKYKLGETVTVRGNTGNLGKTGHNFTGWENTTHHVFKQGDTFTITGITTLKANWTANVTTVNYRNATAINATKDYAYNTIADIPEIPAKRGYVFNGWRNMSDGSLFYKNATSFNSTYFNTSGYWIFSGDNASIINVIENLTANVTTVTFKNEITPEKEGKYTFDADAESADVLTKPGHMFIGWFDAGKVKVFNATGELNKSTTYASGTKWNYTDPSLTLWANFTVNTYNITYIQPDHGTVSGNANATYNSTVTVTATPADGFMFRELIVTENGTAQKVTSTGKTFKMPAFDVNVTAVFVPKKEEIIVSSDTISFGTVDLNKTSKGAEGLSRTLNVTNNLNDTVTLDLNESVKGAFNISPSISTKLAPYTSETYTITIKPTYYTTVNDYAALLNFTNGTAAFDQTVVLSLSIVNTTDVRKNTTVVPDLPQMDIKTNSDKTQNVTVDEKNTEVIISEEGTTTVIIRNDTDAKVAMVITNAINSTVSGKQEIKTNTDSKVTNVYTVVKADLLQPENEKIEYQVIVSYGNTIPSQSPVTLTGDFIEDTAEAVSAKESTKSTVLSMVSAENEKPGQLDTEIEGVRITFEIPKTAVTNADNLQAYHVNASGVTKITPSIDSTGTSYNVTVTGNGFDAYVVSELFPSSPYVPSSHSKETGSTVILKDGEVVPTVTPTPSGNATILPTARPTQPTTSKSPAPLAGIVLGLGAALVIARLRK